MKENSIEQTIKQLELILKARKIHKECVGKSCINCNPDIEALTNSIEFLSDYKRVLKENEELKGQYAEYVKLTCNEVAKNSELNSEFNSEGKSEV